MPKIDRIVRLNELALINIKSHFLVNLEMIEFASSIP